MITQMLSLHIFQFCYKLSARTIVFVYNSLLLLQRVSHISEDVAELSGMFGRQGSLSPNSIILQGESPLHISVRKDRLHSTKVLIAQGADVNLQVLRCV